MSKTITPLRSIILVSLCWLMPILADKEAGIIAVNNPRTPETTYTKPKKRTTSRNLKEVYNDAMGNIGLPKSINHMDYNELKEAKELALSKNELELALKILQKMQPLCDNMVEAAQIIFEIADLYFDMGKLDKAQALYYEYSRDYPGTAQVEVALYKAVLCSFLTILDADRDQTRTRETLERAHEFLQHVDFVEWAPDVKKIVVTCNQRLFEHQTGIVAFYLQRGKTKSATKRLDTIRKEFLDKLPDCELAILKLELQLAQQTHNAQAIEQKQTEIAQKFPTEAVTILAQSNQTHKKAINRF